MALSPALRRLLDQQRVGLYAGSQQNSAAGDTMSNLQSAIGRRFGQRSEFDSEYDSALRGLMGQIPTIEGAYQKNVQRTDEDFTTSAEDLFNQKGLADSRHLNIMANNGMGFSGANLVGQQRLGEQFQQGVQGLTRNRTRTLEDLNDTTTGAYQDITSRSNTLQAGAAGRATARDEERAWQAEQVRMEQERAQHEQEMADRQLQQSQIIFQQNQEALAQLRQQMVQMSQPRPSPTGVYVRPAPPSAPIPARATQRPPVQYTHTPELSPGGFVPQNPKKKSGGFHLNLNPFSALANGKWW